MVYQGTTWGPPLWNCFYEDASKAVRLSGFTDAVLADDLTCYQIYSSSLRNEGIKDELEDWVSFFLGRQTTDFLEYSEQGAQSADYVHFEIN